MAPCCNEVANLEPWDCACSWGCACCEYAATCKVCGAKLKTGQVVQAQRSAGLCASPWCKAAPAPKINRCREHLSRRERRQYDAARARERAPLGGSRC